MARNDAGKRGKDVKEKKPRFARTKQIYQAYKVSKQYDPALPWWMLLSFVLVATVIEVPAILFATWWIGLPFALLIGAMVAMIVFGRRAQKGAFNRVEGQPGAAAWVLEGMRGDWRVTPSVAGTAQLDAVHRVLGRPGVVLVAEGSERRVKSLLAQEKKKVARVVGDTPIYDIIVGDEEGQVPLRKLGQHVMKIPRNLSAGQVNALERRVAAIGGPKMPIPQGPLPKGRQMAIQQRQLRRRGGG